MGVSRCRASAPPQRSRCRRQPIGHERAARRRDDDPAASGERGGDEDRGQRVLREDPDHAGGGIGSFRIVIRLSVALLESLSVGRLRKNATDGRNTFPAAQPISDKRIKRKEH